MDLTNYPYSSSRRVIIGSHVAAATSQHLATLAAMEMFSKGGNAVDAAIAAAIALTVVEPTSNGIGSDAFALVWDGRLHGINGSGKSPANLSLKDFSDIRQIPETGWLSVTVPGAVSVWQALSKRWGVLEFEELFTPAIRIAKEGFPVSPVTATAWREAENIYLPLEGKEYEPFKAVFFPQNRAPYPGEIWGSINHATTLKEIAASGGESFYRGNLAEAIARFAADTGGLITTEDLANHQPISVEPIYTDYRGVRVWEIPPNTQGIAALMALNILENFEMERNRESAENYHRQIEAMKLAFADVYHYVGDPEFMQVTTEQLLDKTYTKKRYQLIQSQAMDIAIPGLPQGGTVYLATADNDLMVSFIQSNYLGFGSGILIPETGIALQCRGSGFTLEPGHPNQVAPNKRPFHTIIPAFLTQDNKALGPFGVMGAPMQPQGHLQVVVNLVDYNLNPQAALDAPRWRFIESNKVLLEPTVSTNIMLELAQKGHNIQIADYRMFGKGQIILKQKGVLLAASEGRADGIALAV